MKTTFEDLGATLLAGDAVPAPPICQGQRLDKCLAELLQGHGVSRAKGKEWIKLGLVRLNSAPCLTPRQLLQEGDALQLNRPDTRPEVLAAAEPSGSLRALYDDADLIVVNKPAGLTVHPAPSCQEETLVHQLLAAYPDMAAMGTERPGIVHRIDKDTSGLLAVAKHEKARQRLARAFADRAVDKAYVALCHGVPSPAQGRIDAPMGRHPTRKTCMAVVQKGGRPAVSDYKVLHADPSGGWSLLLVHIHTGRTHQIRVHMRHIGHPLLGDTLYGGVVRSPGDLHTMRIPSGPRQMLHAWQLGLTHPETSQPLSFALAPPKDFLGTMLRLSRRCQRVVITGLPGCGKSALVEALAAAGIPTFSADACVRALQAPGEDGHAMLRGRYGDRFLLEDQTLDRSALFVAMRTQPGVRQEVEALLHPMVQAQMARFWDSNAGTPLAVAEVPLAVEAGWDTGEKAAGEAPFDLLVGVHCSRHVRHARLREKRGWDEGTIAAMDAWQWSEAAKLNRCQLIVDNSRDLAALQLHTAALRRVLAMLRASQSRRQWRMLQALLHTS